MNWFDGGKGLGGGGEPVGGGNEPAVVRVTMRRTWAVFPSLSVTVATSVLAPRWSGTATDHVRFAATGAA